ncbi:MAG: MBOAT family protein [Clostridia bacterium]|nr:MBOAT family protein [Clostridia bacterium]
MALNSAGFVFFAALVILVYYLLPEKSRWVFLLVCSAVFYASAGIFGIIYPLAVITATYISALSLEKIAKKQTAYLGSEGASLGKEEKKACKKRYVRRRKAVVLICVLFDVSVLAAGKYLSPFIGGGISKSAGLGLILPLGISFFTLQAIGYLVDVYRGAVAAERNWFRFALFVSFFPAIVQGPICRFGELGKELCAPHPFDEKALFRGVTRMLWGFFKKMVVADRIGAAVSTVAGSSGLRGAYVLVLLLFYTVQLYADFTGGIDIAIGFSETLGIRLPENFNLPYLSGSLKEYWRRWHITMCSWFRDYVFYPVSTSAAVGKITALAKSKLGKKAGRRVPLYIASFAAWFLTGVWHGAGANFIVWGLLNWLVLMVSEELEPLYARFGNRFGFTGSAPYRAFTVIRTFALVCVLNLFDCFPKVGDTLGALFSLFSVRNAGVLFDGSLMNLGLTGTDYVLLAVGIALMIAVAAVGKKHDLRDAIYSKPYAVRLAAIVCLAAAVVIFGAYGIGYDASSFIYNRF